MQVGELQYSLDSLGDYCRKLKLKVNVKKTKAMAFRKGGILPNNLIFNYVGEPFDIVKSFKYLEIVFTNGGSFAGQAQKGIFTLKIFFLSLHLFHRSINLNYLIIMPILNCGSEVWGFCQSNTVERVHLKFCKMLLGVKKTTQNDFLCCELGRTNCSTKRYSMIAKYWFKPLAAQGNKLN